MANPITWRSVTAPSTSSDLAIALTGVRQGGMGLADRAAKAASNMDAEQLNAALNQIQQLNQIGQAQSALNDSNFISGLGLRTDAQEMQARNALRTQMNNNRSNLRADEAFGDATLARDDINTLNLIDEARAAGDVELQDSLSDQLNFNSGKTQIALNDENKQKRKTRAIEDLDQQTAVGTIKREQAIQNNFGISNSVLEAMPEQLRNEMTLTADGQIKFSDRVGQKQKDLITQAIASVGEYQTPKDFAEIRRDAVAGASPLVGSQNLLQTQDQIANMRQRDPIVIKDRMGKQAFDKFELASAALERDNVLRQNPATPLTPILGLGDVETATQKYLDLARTNDTWGEIGTGDYKQVVDASTQAMDLARRALGRDVHMESLVAALSIAPQVLEAKADGGNLGDYFGDRVDSQKLADLIIAEDSKRFNRFNDQLDASNAANQDFIKTQYGIDARSGIQR